MPSEIRRESERGESKILQEEVSAIEKEKDKRINGHRILKIR
jgi:hypothetical protein